MKKAKEIRNGNVLKMKNEIFRVLKAEHFNPSEKACVMKLKLENIISGQVSNDIIPASDAVDDLKLDTREMQYLYSSGDTYTFMDNENYEQLEVEKDQIGDNVVFLQEEMNITVQFYEGRVVSIELPTVVVAEIDYTEEVERGNTSGNLTKDAKLANGHEIKVPAFIKQGEKVKIDTRTGEYISRA